MRVFFLLSLLFSAFGWQVLLAQPYVPYRVPSYNAVSLVQRTNFPVGLYSGTVDISLPITTLQSRTLSLPVALTYLPGGVKVGTIASWVGLNWSLEAGGVVARVSWGSPDTYSRSGSTITQAGAEPDIYYVRMAGRGLKFAWFGSTHGFRTMPYQQVQIIPSWSGTSGTVTITGFTIIDEGGTQYVFDVQEQTQYVLNNGTPEIAQTDAWYLSSITASDFSDQITLAYQDYVVNSHYVARGAAGITGPHDRRFSNSAAGGYATGANTAGGLATNCTNCPAAPTTDVDACTVNQIISTGKRLISIAGVNNRIDFIKHATTRTDVPGTDYALRYVRLINTFDGQTQQVAEWELVTDYFRANCTGTGITNEARLRLAALKQNYTEDATAKSLTTTLSYNETYCLPARNSLAQDEWGYYNGRNTNTQFNRALSGGSKTPNAAYKTTGILTGIATPGGAKTVYNWEAGTFGGANSVAAGLMRIQQVTVQPNGEAAAADNIVKQYKYRPEGSTTASSGVRVGNFDTYQAGWLVMAGGTGCTPPTLHPNVACNYRFHHSYSQTDFGSDTPTEYARVVEEHGANLEAGFSEYLFRVRTDAGLDDGLATTSGPFTFRGWKRGQVKRVRHYDVTNPASPQVVKFDSTNYTVYETGNPNWRKLDYTWSWPVSFGGGTFSFTKALSHESGWMAATSSVNTTYTQDEPPVPITSNAYTYYNPITMLPCSTEVDPGVGRVEGTMTKYVEDYTITGSPTAAEVLAIQNLQTRMIKGVPVEVLSYYSSTPNSSTKNITGGSVATFQNVPINNTHSGGNRTIAKPFKSFSLQLGQPKVLGTSAPAAETYGPVGTLLTITGTSLTSLTTVTIGGTPSIIVNRSPTQAQILVMPGTTSGAVVGTGSGVSVTPTNFNVTTVAVSPVSQGKQVGTGAVGASQQGTSLALSADGNTAILGAEMDNSGVGAAWIFVRNAGTWSQQSKLVGTGSVGAGQQGNNVSISADGNTAIVGGSLDNSSVGAAWIFVRNGTTWSQQAKLVATDAVGASRQGYGVSLSADGNTAVVGGFGDNADQGAAWVYVRSGSSWSQQGNKLVGTGATGAAQQGFSVDLSADGNTLILGGRLDNSSQGAAWLFTRSGTTWSQQGSKLTGTGGVGTPRLGYSVAISADATTAIVGGYLDNSNRGAAWIFIKSGTSWIQQGTKLFDAATSGNLQGTNVGLSADGNVAVVSGWRDDATSGGAWIYTRNSSAVWSQQGGKLITTGAVSPTREGRSAAISADGTTVWMGGSFDNSQMGAGWAYYSTPPTSPGGTGSNTQFTQSNIAGTTWSVDPLYEASWRALSTANTYNTFGQLLVATDLRGVKSSTVYGYNSTVAVAGITNAEPSQFAYAGFEGEAAGGFTHNTTTAIKTATADVYAGRKAYQLSLGNITKTGVPVGEYLISYWAKGATGSAPITVNTVSVTTTASPDDAVWKLYQHKLVFTAATNTVTIATASANTAIRIDELRLQPIDAQMTHQVLALPWGVGAAFNAWNVPVFTEYDNLGRVSITRDEEGYIRQYNKYNIKQ